LCNIVRDNHANSGAGIYIHDTTFSSEGDVLARNLARINGGAMSLINSELRIGRTKMKDNRASYDSRGGGLYFSKSSIFVDGKQIPLHALHFPVNSDFLGLEGNKPDGVYWDEARVTPAFLRSMNSSLRSTMIAEHQEQCFMHPEYVPMFMGQLNLDVLDNEKAKLEKKLMAGVARAELSEVLHCSKSVLGKFQTYSVYRLAKVLAPAVPEIITQGMEVGSDGFVECLAEKLCNVGNLKPGVDEAAFKTEVHDVAKGIRDLLVRNGVYKGADYSIVDLERRIKAQAVRAEINELLHCNHPVLNKFKVYNVYHLSKKLAPDVIKIIRGGAEAESDEFVDKVSSELYNSGELKPDVDETKFKAELRDIAFKIQDAMVCGGLYKLAVYERRAKRDPNDPFANFALGKYHLGEGRLDQAEVRLWKTLGNLSENKGLGYKLSKVFVDLAWARLDLNEEKDWKQIEEGNFEKARLLFHSAALINPNNLKSHYGLGICCYHHAERLEGDAIKDKFMQAKDAYVKAHKLEPDHPMLNADLGSCLLRLRAYEGAADHLKKATRLGVEEGWVYNALGCAYKGFDKIDEAREAHQRAVELGFDASKEHLANLEGK
jgi:tetratricopeptide (TPR) repeat protein